MAHPTRPPRIVTRLVDESICAYGLAAGARGELAPTLVCRPSAGDDIVDHAASADLRDVYYTTLNAAVRVTADGAEVWRSAFAPHSDQEFGHRPDCALSLDEGVLWVYRPDAMAGRGRPDQWTALDAGTGAVLARADLRTVGHGALHLPHPAGQHMLLDVGEGQDGSVIYRASLAGDGMELYRYPWEDRCLIDLAPDGSQFMTVHHQQTDIALHTYPGGEVTRTLPVEDFGWEPDEAQVAWSGGYLDQDTVVVALAGESEDGRDWYSHFFVDARSGEVLESFDAQGEHAYDVQPLGDGSWLTAGPSGHPVRHAGAVAGSPV